MADIVFSLILGLKYNLNYVIIFNVSLPFLIEVY